MRASFACIAGGVGLGILSAWGFAHAQIGSVIQNVEMPRLGGSRHHLLSDAKANVFIFFKPGQEHSRATLKQIAACEKELAGKSVHWVAIASDRFSRAEVEAEVKETGIAMPVLIDIGDALYGRLGVALCPVAGLTDQEHKLAAYLPFAKVNYTVTLHAHIRHLLKEISDHELQLVLQPPAATAGGDAELARRRLKLAEKHFLAGNHAQALESARKSIEKDSSMAAAHALLGQILVAQGKRAEALAAFEQALKLCPTNAVALDGKRNCQGQPH